MAISSLRYSGGAKQGLETTAKGDVIYSGSAAGFFEWEFRTLLKLKATKDEDMPKVTSKIVEHLRGDAFQIAVDPLFPPPFPYPISKLNSFIMPIQMRQNRFSLIFDD